MLGAVGLERLQPKPHLKVISLRMKYGVRARFRNSLLLIYLLFPINY